MTRKGQEGVEGDEPATKGTKALKEGRKKKKEQITGYYYYYDKVD